MADPVRALDQTTTSMDVVALNNVVVNMRKLVKRAKLHVITKITKQIKMYRKKKGTDQQVESNKRRAERLVQEIELIKKANVDRVAKFSLANTRKSEQLSANDPLETRAMTRISCHPLMQERIKKFRSEHDDWTSLAAFLLSKNTGRRFKNKKKKEKQGKQTIQNESDNDSDDDIDEGKDEDSDADQNSDMESEVATEKTRPAQSSSNDKLENSSENESDGNEKNGSENNEGNESENTSDSESESEKEEEASDRDSDASDEEFSNKMVKKDSKQTVEKKQATKTKTMQSKSSKITNETSNIKSQTEKAKLPATHLKQNREMVVKKLNLNNLDAELEALSKPAKETEDISFLFKSSNKDNENSDDDSSDNEKIVNNEETKVTKRRDAFFIMGDEDSDDNDDMEVDNEDEDANEDIEEDSYDNMHARSLVDSTFIESLGRKKSKKKQLQSQTGSHDGNFRGRGRGSWRGQNFRGSSRGGRHFDSSREKWQGKLHQKPYSQQRPPMSGKTFGNQARGDYKRNDTHSQKPRQQYNNSRGGATAAPSTEKLHPSWEASKKKKEQAMHIPSFTGKKTTFDD